jgi:hypothetical protein
MSQQLLIHSRRYVSSYWNILDNALAAASTFMVGGRISCYMFVQDPKPVLKPDPLVRGTDPRIWIRTEMSRIHKTTTLIPSIVQKESEGLLQ